ncbi:NTP transferase domain-containing protein [bacterium]|nr:NTP transferase domain-containing protein [bacterium]
MKGIILAGGSGTRLHPLTKITSKQLLPVYDKPMIYYPLQTLLDAGITEILIIVAPDRAGDFLRLLGSGKEFGAKFTYEIQDRPEGLAQAFIIGKTFIGEDDVTMILGDNIFVGDEVFLRDAIRSFKGGARVFAKEVPDPERFGVVEFDAQMHALTIEEKPRKPKSNFAVTGLYIYDNAVVARSEALKPSQRGELEITDLNNLYLRDGMLDVRTYTGFWLDTGTFDTLLDAGIKVREYKQRRAG